MAAPALVWPTQLSTVVKAEPFEPEKACDSLRKAMKGLGTDEATIIKILASHCNAQRQELDKKYKAVHGRDLRDDLVSDLSGDFRTIALALLDHPRVYDAKECNQAIAGLGTNEDTLIEILCTRSNEEIQEIRTQYKALYKRELERDIQSDTSGDFKRLLISLVTGNREYRPQPDVELAKKEAMELYKAGEKKFGTDEAVFNRILALRSHAQLRETFAQYGNLSNKDFEAVISSELSGDLERGCLALVKAAKNLPAYFAERLHFSMKGLGTHDKILIRVVVSRSEVDMVAIKSEFERMYGKTLASFIKGDTSGDYKKLLMSVIGE